MDEPSPPCRDRQAKPRRGGAHSLCRFSMIVLEKDVVSGGDELLVPSLRIVDVLRDRQNTSQDFGLLGVRKGFEIIDNVLASRSHRDSDHRNPAASKQISEAVGRGSVATGFAFCRECSAGCPSTCRPETDRPLP